MPCNWVLKFCAFISHFSFPFGVALAVHDSDVRSSRKRFPRRRFISNPEKKKTSRANQEVFWTTPQSRHLPVAQNWSAAAEGAYMRTPRKTNCASSTRRIHSADDQTREKVPRYPLAVLLRPKAPYWEIQHQGFWKINLAKLLAWLRFNFARRSHFVVYFFLLYTGLSALVFVNAKKNLFSSMGSD